MAIASLTVLQMDSVTSSLVPEQRQWFYILSRGPQFQSLHSSFGKATREAQALQGARHVEFKETGDSRPGRERWSDSRSGWEIARSLLDP